LLVEGKKMSKSLGNFFTLRDLLAKGYSGREIRALLLSAHYRETFNFTLDGLQSARASLQRLDECLFKLHELAGDTQAPPEKELESRVRAALEEDLNISAAWAAVFEWVREKNRQIAGSFLNAAAAAAALAAWHKVDAVFGVGRPLEAEAPAEILALLEGRQAARKSKDFKRADALRDELKAKGWAIEDTPKGARVKKLT
jgi:cysteinyl-tRNA synthetase